MKALPVGSMLTATLSGELESVKPGVSFGFHIQNSVALNTLRSWQVEMPNADVTALLARLGLLLAPALVVDHAERLVEHGLVVAAVVHVAGRHDVGELVLPDQVAPAHLDVIDVELLAGRHSTRRSITKLPTSEPNPR